MKTYLYYHVKQGSEFDPHSLVGEHASSSDSFPIETGDRIGRMTAIDSQCRKILEAAPGVTILPPMHRQIKQEHIDAFGHAGAAEGDYAYDVAEKLYETHKPGGNYIPW